MEPAGNGSKAGDDGEDDGEGDDGILAGHLPTRLPQLGAKELFFLYDRFYILPLDDADLQIEVKLPKLLLLSEKYINPKNQEVKVKIISLHCL